jgi:hypothetical protein
MNISEIQSLVSSCSQEQLAEAGVDLIVETDPANEPADDYKCVYRVKFQPRDVAKANLEINVLESKFGGSGFVEIGVDDFGRTARRLHKWTGQPQVWIGTWMLDEIGDLELLLAQLSQGNAFVMTRSLGRWIFSAELLLPQSAYDSAPNLAVRHYTKKRSVEPFLGRRPWLSRIDRYTAW